jgi:hypothetical protein
LKMLTKVSLKVQRQCNIDLHVRSMHWHPYEWVRIMFFNFWTNFSRMTKVFNKKSYFFIVIYMWRFMCNDRWSLREKARSQSWHWKGRSPVCFL